MFIRDSIPTDIIFFPVYDPELGISKIIASADVTSGIIVAVKTVVQAKTRQHLDERNKAHRLTERFQLIGYFLNVIYKDALY
jgi:hypothetical protein